MFTLSHHHTGSKTDQRSISHEDYSGRKVKISTFGHSSNTTAANLSLSDDWAVWVKTLTNSN